VVFGVACVLVLCLFIIVQSDLWYYHDLNSLLVVYWGSFLFIAP